MTRLVLLAVLAPGCPSGPPCPSDMALVEDVCVDRHEASLDASGAARSVAGAMPTTGLTWPAAVEACAKAGKHLCTDAEWTAACHGRRWPWGDEPPAPGRCGLPGAEGTPGAKALVPTGSYPGCASPEGVYDLAGNAWEWTQPAAGSRSPTAKRGGAWYIASPNPCAGAPFDLHPQNFLGTIVARCCAPAEAGSP